MGEALLFGLIASSRLELAVCHSDSVERVLSHRVLGIFQGYFMIPQMKAPHMSDAINDICLS